MIPIMWFYNTLHWLSLLVTNSYYLLKSLLESFLLPLHGLIIDIHWEVFHPFVSSLCEHVQHLVTDLPVIFQKYTYCVKHTIP